MESGVKKKRGGDKNMRPRVNYRESEGSSERMRANWRG